MAINSNVYANEQTKWGYIQQTTWGTPDDGTGNYTMFEGPPPTGIDYGVTRSIEHKFDGGRVKQYGSIFYTESGGLRVIPFSDVIVRRLDLPVLLYGVMQNVDEGESSAYFKTYTWDETTTQPDFASLDAASDLGYMATIGIYDPIASNHRLFEGCILRSLTLSADLSGDGRLRASGEWISGFANDVDVNFNSGTWGYAAQNYYNFNEMTKKQIENTDMVVYGFSITFTNNAVRVGSSSAGEAETYALPMYDITGEITVKYDANTDGFIADAIAGTGKEIDLAVGDDTPNAGYFSIVLDEVYFDNPTKDYSGEMGQAITLPFTAALEQGANMAVVSVADGTDRGWAT